MLSPPRWDTKIRFRGLELKNRIVKAATHDGATFAEMRSRYVALARNDVAMITVAYVAVSPIDKTFDEQLHIGEDNEREWTRLVADVHSAGSKVAAQLHHPGLFTMAEKGTPCGPSAGWLPSTHPPTFRSMSPEDLARVKREYYDAARLCARVGFDAIELHCGHGYLLSQFLTPILNRRSDAYGGSPEKRARYPRDILDAVRNGVGDDVPIFIKMNGDDGFLGGLRIRDALVAAKMFAEKADGIVVSGGYTSLNGFGMLRGNVPAEKMAKGLGHWFLSFIMRYFGRWLVPHEPYNSLFFKATARRFVDALRNTKCRVIYVGGADSERAIEEVLSNRIGCDVVQLGRPLLREPDFVKRMRKEGQSSLGRPGALADDVKSKCIRCNLCTLASINPKMFKAGCVFAEDTHLESRKGLRPLRDIEDLSISFETRSKL